MTDSVLYEFWSNYKNTLSEMVQAAKREVPKFVKSGLMAVLIVVLIALPYGVLYLAGIVTASPDNIQLSILAVVYLIWFIVIVLPGVESLAMTIES